MKAITLFILATILVFTSCENKEDKVIKSNLETIYFQLSSNDLSVLTPSADCQFYNIDKYSSTILTDFLREIKFNSPEQIEINYSDNTTATIRYLLKFSSPKIKNDGEIVTINAKKIGEKWRFDLTNFFGSYIVKENSALENEAERIADSIRKQDMLEAHISDSLNSVYNTK